ncbi:MAG TPA: CopG family antitoxin [Burkholderiaceae bacterium]|nr:CopG family antitoxin [Burkholderiaceae bacterium]
MNRKLPDLSTDEAAADFVAQADLTQFDLSTMTPTRFEFAPKEARVNMRLPGDLLAAVKVAAEKAGMPYQRFIRQALEAAVNR